MDDAVAESERLSLVSFYLRLFQLGVTPTHKRVFTTGSTTTSTSSTTTEHHDSVRIILAITKLFGKTPLRLLAA